MKICTSPEHNSAKTGTCRNALATPRAENCRNYGTIPDKRLGLRKRAPPPDTVLEFRLASHPLASIYAYMDADCVWNIPNSLGVQPSETIEQRQSPVCFRIGQSETARTVCGSMSNNSLCASLADAVVGYTTKGMPLPVSGDPGIGHEPITDEHAGKMDKSWANERAEIKSHLVVHFRGFRGACANRSEPSIKGIHEACSPLDQLSSSPSAYKRQLRRRRHIGTLELGEYHVNHHNLSDLDSLDEVEATPVSRCR
ncbi:hypothetical protein CVT26_012878 [Gymnopilus dilepis]|uniref:Uncharacterized protein n=1 Tax=Gymnopilus dilepis TaxID=231916 RepID=A0A409YP05_9AGAR|nr:hypothetical protein CVT26_012878 [Gymnopilus dilepis]